jgi:hypothetical protein
MRAKDPAVFVGQRQATKGMVSMPRHFTFRRSSRILIPE